MYEKTLLIVDDEAPIRATLAQVFQQMGYEVRLAGDGFEALEQMRGGAPDVLLSDLNMPGMSGFELLSVVRRRLPGVYVIATSGAYRGKDVPEGIAADAFYEKASGFGTLIEMMQAAMTLQPPARVREAMETVLWVTRVGDELEGESYGMVSCLECLRAFAHPLPATAPMTVHEVYCRDCGAVIRYAVVRQLDPATSQPYAALGAMAPVRARTGRIAPGRMAAPLLRSGTAG
jgi:CheY-like chemotaxis protein